MEPARKTFPSPSPSLVSHRKIILLPPFSLFSLSSLLSHKAFSGEVLKGSRGSTGGGGGEKCARNSPNPGKRIPVPYREKKSLSKVVPSRRKEERGEGKKERTRQKKSGKRTRMDLAQSSLGRRRTRTRRRPSCLSAMRKSSPPLSPSVPILNGHS